MVRLVWFPGYMDWERKKYTWEIRGQNADVRGARSFAQCVSLVLLIFTVSDQSKGKKPQNFEL